MEAVAASLVAVLGTALGAALTHVLQRRNALRAEAMCRAELLTASAELTAAGRRALKDTDRMDLARTREELAEPRLRSREAVYAYVAAARGLVPGAVG
ncbi:hypothetical protein [Streptomyces sp. NPDC047046]|uniref:hypothetical protein n=1 Tax=Streptomyces sp. NPDC047046 TaxID=3155378 RepID=UPI0033D94E47